MTWRSSILSALAAHLTASGVNAPVHALQLPATPDLALALTPYPVTEDPSLPDAVLGVQVRCRGTPNNRATVLDLDDQVFEVLHGLAGIHLGGFWVTQIQQRSSSSLGADTANRWQWQSSYWLDVEHPSALRGD